MTAPHRPLRARGRGLTLTEGAGPPTDAAHLDALGDGVARGYRGPLPQVPAAARWLLVRRQGEPAATLAVRLDAPAVGDATVDALAVAAHARGRGTGTWALLLLERRLRALGMLSPGGRLHARVSQTNGRGFYFMLRAGFRPCHPPLLTVTGADGDSDTGDGAGEGDDGADGAAGFPVTWFVREAVPPVRAAGERPSS